MDLPDHVHVAVLVGTDHHPFDRIVAWATTLAAEDGQPWLVQHGTTAWPVDAPAALHGVPMLGISDLESVLQRADVVVTHGGPGLIMEARAAGHVPVVVPRDPAVGEHVDGHQQDFTARLAAEGTVVRADTLEEFRTAVRTSARQGRPHPGDDDTASTGTPNAAVARFADLVDETLARPRVTLLQRLRRR